MSKGRLEAFRDGAIAILMTITMLELHMPSVPDRRIEKTPARLQTRDVSGRTTPCAAEQTSRRHVQAGKPNQ